jgi:L-malate glycosyltransferase
MKKEITVLYIANGDSYGSGKALLNLLKEVSTFGIRSFVVLRTDLGLKSELDDLNIPSKILPFRLDVYPEVHTFIDILLFFPRLLKTIYVNQKAVTVIESLAQEITADLIHTNVGVFRVGAKAAKRLRIPHVWHIREYQDLDMGYRIMGTKNGFSRWLRKHENYPIAITRGIHNYFKMGHNARIIYDGVRKVKDVQFITVKEHYFLYVGNISEHKGINQLLDAFIEFANYDKEYKLFIVGVNQGDYSKGVFRIVEKAGLGDRICFLGYRTDIDDLMAKATALIVASRWEGFGLITAEAMFNGCLVIGNNTAGTREQFDNGLKRHGCEIGIRYNSFEDLVMTMKVIAHKGVERFFPMMHKAQETVIAFYSIEKNAQEVLKLYKEILEQ